MLKSAIVRTVDVCARHPWTVIVAAGALFIASLLYVAHNFAITTNIAALISEKSPSWQRQVEYNRAFPTHSVIAVVDAAAPELVARAADQLTSALAQRGGVIRAVRQPGGGEFFARNGLLFLPTEDVVRTAEG